MSQSLNEGNYLLNNRHRQAGFRLESISALFDETSFRHMRQLGLGTGWRCWEVGAGGPSVPTFLGQEVGPSGFVVATDIDVTWANVSGSSNVKIMQHDVVREDPPEGQFDLIHARLVLVHLPERQTVLQRLVDALRPGGWLLIEDADPALQPLACIDAIGSDHVLANKIRNCFRQLMKERGVNLSYGRTLPSALREVGLQDVMADGFFPLARSECNFLEVATINLLRDQLVERNLVTNEEIDITIENLTNGKIEVTTSPLISAWGHRAY